ncbi:hypothetical protein IEQ34_003447 [Dendrobium chrysotoxum]|uniref:Uncharacterized protein n=1 Tax=Dendrobium chrysotoxum TaxID=161865 RepID=A0AAV7HJM8_DENCH|nr:hypothetical protein IEQ34_003447 [Dendrobium chrysotoxum]
MKIFDGLLFGNTVNTEVGKLRDPTTFLITSCSDGISIVSGKQNINIFMLYTLQITLTPVSGIDFLKFPTKDWKKLNIEPFLFFINR